MKIALVGTSCVGKTWLFEKLRSRFADYPRVQFVEEAARMYFQGHPEVRNRFSFVAQANIQALVHEMEQKAETNHPVVTVCDRSVLDAAAYVYAQGGYDGAALLVSRMTGWLPTYTTLYLLDPEGVAFETDGIRRESAAQRKFWHDGFVGLFREHNIPYELLSGTKEERFERALQAILPHVS